MNTRVPNSITKTHSHSGSVHTPQGHLSHSSHYTEDSYDWNQRHHCLTSDHRNSCVGVVIPTIILKMFLRNTYTQLELYKLLTEHEVLPHGDSNNFRESPQVFPFQEEKHNIKNQLHIMQIVKSCAGNWSLSNDQAAWPQKGKVSLNKSTQVTKCY